MSSWLGVIWKQLMVGINPSRWVFLDESGVATEFGAAGAVAAAPGARISPHHH